MSSRVIARGTWYQADGTGLQVGTSNGNPVFAFFCNLPQYVKESYTRYLENRMREHFDFTGWDMALFAAGGEIRQSWCGPCFGQGPDALSRGQRAITSFLRASCCCFSNMAMSEYFW